jgi:hypothetical protein
MKKRECVTLIVVIIILMMLSMIFLIKKPSFTGFAVGNLTMGLLFNLEIHSPENKTYNYSREFPNYTLDLNVTIDKSNMDTWWYTLIDDTQNLTVNSSVIFTPNTTINAVRYSNKLIVYANDTGGNIYNDSVIFFIFINNSNPIILDLPLEDFVCEDQLFSRTFLTYDKDGDSLVPSMTPTWPNSPFFIQTYPPHPNFTTKRFEIFSGILSKINAGGAQAGWKMYFENVSIRDPFYAVDNGYINITVIEINHAPVIQPVGVQTIWIVGDGRNFYHELNVTDTEDGDRTSGNLYFNITFSNQTLFNITQDGVMNFTANESYLGPNETSRVHDITVCVSDRGLLNPHPNLTAHCLQDGSNMSSCSNFSLTITRQNRPPEIVNFYPNNSQTITRDGETLLYFNITKYDPDGPAIDTYWFLDGVEMQYDPYQANVSVDEFSYMFPCGVEGSHNFKSEITDGELNDSVQWNFSITLKSCDTPGGPGGPGRKIFCQEKWGCGEWHRCRNLQKDFEAGRINREIEFLVSQRCLLFGWKGENCGFQIRDCIDVNNCGTNSSIPPNIKECYYTEFPTCFDGIKNCHDGACEVGIDCGGTCPPCPTCTDKIKNQGEEGVDCGGPCPSCKWEEPLKIPVFQIIIFSLIGFFIVFIIIIFLLFLNYYKKKQKLEGIAKKRKIDTQKSMKR